MEYKANIAFAMRTINLYRIAKKITPDFAHTLSLGALHNIFSVIIPDQKFVIATECLLSHPLPYFIGASKDEAEEYLKVLRNGLAHKTEENFKDIMQPGSDEIFKIKLSSRAAKKSIQLSCDDLDSIIETIDAILSIQYSDIHRHESRMFAR